MVTKKPKGLGLGLEALLGPRVPEAGATAAADAPPRDLPLSLLQPGKYQPRTRMDEGSLYELAESIKATEAEYMTFLKIDADRRDRIAAFNPKGK